MSVTSRVCRRVAKPGIAVRPRMVRSKLGLLSRSLDLVQPLRFGVRSRVLLCLVAFSFPYNGSEVTGGPCPGGFFLLCPPPTSLRLLSHSHSSLHPYRTARGPQEPGLRVTVPSFPVATCPSGWCPGEPCRPAWARQGCQPITHESPLDPCGSRCDPGRPGRCHRVPSVSAAQRLSHSAVVT